MAMTNALPASQSQELPQKLNTNHSLFVAMTILGTPVTLPFQVDTGADVTLLPFYIVSQEHMSEQMQHIQLTDTKVHMVSEVMLPLSSSLTITFHLG